MHVGEIASLLIAALDVAFIGCADVSLTSGK